MNLKNILTEREFVVIDPRGNARPVGMKMQGAQYVKRMGGPKKGYHLTDHDGKAAPYGSGYEKVDESTKLKDVIKEFEYTGIKDNTMLRYKDPKTGEMELMQAGSAKKLPDDHPAKIAYNKEKKVSDKFLKDKGKTDEPTAKEKPDADFFKRIK